MWGWGVYGTGCLSAGILIVFFFIVVQAHTVKIVFNTV